MLPSGGFLVFPDISGHSRPLPADTEVPAMLPSGGVLQLAVVHGFDGREVSRGLARGGCHGIDGGSDLVIAPEC